jgi:beta-lactamase regulating signal transducer with metallopeptidase domain
LLSPFFHTLAAEPLLGRLVLASIEMAVLAVLVWLAIRVGLIRSARWQSFLWLIVLVKPFMVVTMGALVPVIQFEVAPPSIVSAPEPSPTPGMESAISPLGDTQSQTIPATVESHVDTFPESIEPLPAAVPAAPAHHAPVTPPQPTNQPWNVPHTLVQIWVLGMVLLGAHAVFDRWRLRRLVMRARPASPELAARYAGVAESLRIKHPPRLRVTESLESPALAGTIRPTVLLPSWLAEVASSAKLEWALRHELTHWKLGDVWALAAQQIAQIVFFFNPVTWWACRKWQEAAELACDRAVVETERDVEEYADNLYQVLAEIHGQRRGLLAGGLFATRTQIGRRIAMLLGNPLKYRARLGTTGVVVLLVVAAISLSVGVSFVTGARAVAENETVSAKSESESPFSVFGIVTDDDGRPLPGVQIMANCGWGTLRGCGQTISEPDGRYKLQIRPGAEHLPQSVLLQAATIYARMPGRYEKNLCRQGGLGLAGQVPEADSQWPPDMIVLPDKPHRLDFVMLPAAQVHVKLVDGADQPIANRDIVVDGPEIGPSSSALANLTTDERGVAEIDTPCKSYWFELPAEDGEWPKSESVNFERPGPYELTLTYDPKTIEIQGLQLTVNSTPPENPPPVPPSVTKRNWGPEQATGAPDTQGPGDIVTAWASLTQDEQPEWLLLEYERAVRPHSVKIYETYNPGAVVKVSVFDESGEEVLAWEGTDPTRPGQPTGVSEIPIGANTAIRKVKLYLDSPAVPGWNEIDAVGLVDDSGQIHWATAATASSTYAEKSNGQTQPAAEAESITVAFGPGASVQTPEDAAILAYTDGTAEGKRSLGASGHAIRFERSAPNYSERPFLEAVQIAASRYGSPEPPEEDFRLYVLNKDFQVVADLPYPYSMIERGDLQWYTLRTPSIELPETFYIALAFNPHQTKGIYLALDSSVASSHSLQGLPDSGYEAVDETYDWMVRVLLSEKPSGEKGVQRLADWSPPERVDPFEGLVEAKYDDGVSDGMQSYGGAGPYIRYAATTWAKYWFGDRHVPESEALVGLRVYGSRYGSGYDPETTMLHVIIQDQDGKQLAKVDLPYNLFSYKEQWVDLVLPEPIKSNVDEFTIILDPEAHQTKGIYFHYKKDPAESHSGVAKNGKADKPTPDREWMIRGYFRR